MKHKARVHAIHGGERRRQAVAAAPLPAVENRHTRELGHSITYELRPVFCGKRGCNKPHGPYWYAYWTQAGRVRTVYIGKKFVRVEAKCPQKLLDNG
jgi:hypothetical protein